MSESPEHSSIPTGATASPTPPEPPTAAALPAAQAAAAPLPAAPPAAPAAPPAPAAPRPAAGQVRLADPSGATARLQHKSPVIAGLLSLMPGAGQIYVGYYKLGFIHNVVFGTTIAFLATGGGPFPSLVPTMAIFLPFFVIYNIVDAGRRANLYNLAIDGVEGIDLPSMDMDISLPNLGGSIGGGIALIVLSVILLSNTLFGISLAWLAAWWPVVPLGLGVYLLSKALKDRQAAAAATARETDRGSGTDSTPSL